MKQIQAVVALVFTLLVYIHTSPVGSAGNGSTSLPNQPSQSRNGSRILTRQNIDLEMERKALWMRTKLCNFLLKFYKYRLPVEQDFIKGLGKNYCSLLLGYDYGKVCDPYVEKLAKDMFYALDHVPSPTKYDFCQIINNKELLVLNQSNVNWAVPIERNKFSFVTSLSVAAPSTCNKRICHITDMHLALDFTTNSCANCDTPPYCCVSGSVPAPGQVCYKPWPWGDSRCPTPLRTFEALLAFMKNTLTCDIILVTGDFTHHGIWKYDEIETGRHIAAGSDLILQYFPTATIVLAVGNHDTSNCNMFPPKDLWHKFPFVAYDILASKFKAHLPKDMASLSAFKKCGYYTILYPNTKLRFIVINSSMAYLNNFWVAYYPVDPCGQLAWLALVLEAAENNFERVYIACHVPPGLDYVSGAWSQSFNELLLRYENTIVAVFHGHTHTGTHVVSYDYDNRRPFGMQFTTPSVIPDSNLGRNCYSVFYFNEFGGEIGYQRIHCMDLKESTATTVVIKETCKLPEDYGIPALTPGHLFEATQRMLTNDELFTKYVKCSHKGLDTKPCLKDDRKCKAHFLCKSVHSNAVDDRVCKMLKLEAAGIFIEPLSTQKPFMIQLE